LTAGDAVTEWLHDINDVARTIGTIQHPISSSRA